MAWRIRLTPQVEKDLARLSAQDRGRIVRFLRGRAAPDPKALGGPLKGQLREFWRWRVGDYRILARIEDEQLVILVVQVDNRRDVYKKKPA